MISLSVDLLLNEAAKICGDQKALFLDQGQEIDGPVLSWMSRVIRQEIEALVCESHSGYVVERPPRRCATAGWMADRIVADFSDIAKVVGHPIVHREGLGDMLNGVLLDDQRLKNSVGAEIGFADRRIRLRSLAIGVDRRRRVSDEIEGAAQLIESTLIAPEFGVPLRRVDQIAKLRIEFIDHRHAPIHAA